MPTISTLNAETSYVSDHYSPGFGSQERVQLNKLYKLSDRNRHRFCFHQNTDVALHDIIIQYDQESYIPPNKHVGKAETLCILQGEVEVFFFCDDGKCFKRILMGDSGNNVKICRIPMNTWHGLRVVSKEPCVMKETISGPYSKESLMWGSFAPTEAENSSTGCGRQFYEDLASKVPLSVENDQFIELSPNVRLSSAAIPCIRANQLNELRALAEASPLKRARMCLHGNSCELQQDMVIYLAHDCEIPISYHINKDESLVVLGGSGKYDFHYDNSDVCKTVQLDTFRNLEENEFSRCFTRINRFVPHSIKPGADGILIYETTSGPFEREDTAYKLEVQK